MATPAVAPLFDQHSHIIGILLAVAIPTFLTTTKAANSTTAQANLQTALTGANAYWMQEGQTYSGIVSAGNPAVSNISEIDTGANYVSGTNSSGLNVVSLGTDGSTSLVMSAYAPATHDCWTIIDLKAPAALSGGAEKPARRPPGEPAVPEPLFRRVDRSMPLVTSAPDGTLGIAAISLGCYTKSFASE